MGIDLSLRGHCREAGLLGKFAKKKPSLRLANEKKD
jgi:hypothetical protein